MPSTRSSLPAAKSGGNATSEKRMTVAKALFADVFQGSIHTAVDPRSCIPLTRIRGVSTSGVLRLKRIFNGKSGVSGLVGNVGESLGFVAGTDCPIVVPLEGTYSKYIAEYCKNEKVMSDAEIQEQTSARDRWYGVVDGVHRLHALLQLMEEEPERWEGFLWPITVLNGGHSLQVLKQLARHQNIKHSQQQYVETTLYDQLYGLKKEAERLSRERTNGRKPTAREIAIAYDGCGGFMDTTIQQMATAALRIPDVVVSALGDIMNAEHPELVDTSISTKGNRSNMERAEIMSTVDCRVFRRFVNITSLKQTTVFMKAEGEFGTDTQMNTLYRCKEICRRSSFKPVSFRVVVEQYRRATLARKEVGKFEDFLEKKKWPDGMDIMRMNILQTTKFDEEIERNAGNNTVILHSVLSKYKTLHPALCSAKLQKYNSIHGVRKEPPTSEEREEMDDGHVHIARSENRPASVSQEKEGRPVEKKKDNQNVPAPNGPKNNSPEINESNPDQNPDTSRAQDRTEKEERRQSDETCTVDLENGVVQSGTKTEASQRLRTNEQCDESGLLLLKSMHIDCYQMRWQEYDKTVLSQEDSIFDLVLTDPPYGVEPNPAKADTGYKNYVEEQEMKDFAWFCRRVLVPGGYVVIFSSAKYFYCWLRAFKDAGFKPCEYPFILNKNTASIQGTILEDFPQCAAEFSLMARAPGKTPSSFKPDFTSPFHLFECPQKRRYASFIDAPIQTPKLTNGKSRAPLLVEEKNPNVLGELITTFSPYGGRVLDCYGGTLSTAIASIKTGRKCVCVEMNAEIFRPAFSRLVKVAPNYASSNKTRRTGFASPETRTTEKIREQSTEKSAGASITRLHSDSKEHNSKTSGEPETASTALLPGAIAQASDCTKKIAGDDSVILLQDGAEVGFASLQSADDSLRGPVTRRIHGTGLAKFGAEGEDLVAIMRPSIHAGNRKLPYKYTFPTQDDLPRTLADLHQSGVYVWDLKKMKALANSQV